MAMVFCRGCAKEIHSTTVFAAPGTAQDVKAIKAPLQSRLKDADSAKIKGVQVAADGRRAGCLARITHTVRTMNLNHFLGMKLPGGKLYFVGTGDAAAQMCAEKGISPKL